MSKLRRLSWYLHRPVYFLRLVWALPGTATFVCPVCGYRGLFGAISAQPRLNAECRGCGSFERARLFKLMAERHRWLDGAAELLHFAPEPALTGYLRNAVGRYRTSDLHRPADLQLEIEAMDLPDECVDVVVCLHVLEHVDDLRALAELHRVLRPGGLLIVMVPICDGWDHTYENASILTDTERARHFGQRDHVRFYGRDFPDRLRGAGFQVESCMASPEECATYSLIRGERIFTGRKVGIPRHDADNAG